MKEIKLKFKLGQDVKLRIAPEILGVITGLKLDIDWSHVYEVTYMYDGSLKYYYACEAELDGRENLNHIGFKSG